jgi:hypothetical protein
MQGPRVHNLKLAAILYNDTSRWIHSVQVYLRGRECWCAHSAAQIYQKADHYGIGTDVSPFCTFDCATLYRKSLWIQFSLLKSF